MNRHVGYGFSAPISAAIDILPESLRHHMTDVHIVTGCDPVFIGLHAYRYSSDGRSYKHIAHVVYPYHQLTLPKHLRHPTIVLPTMRSICDILHEMGHIVHFWYGLDIIVPAIDDDYARINHHEAFAVAFQHWVLSSNDPMLDEYIKHLFESLLIRSR